MGLTKVTYAMIDGSPANVLDFGATGDGTTDDTAAIQAALDSAQTLYFPAGSYRVKATLDIDTLNRQFIYGDGPESVLVYDAVANNAPMFNVGTNKDNIVFQNLYFSNNNNGNKSGTNCFTVSNDCNSFKWINCTFYAFNNYAVYLQDAMYYEFIGCKFLNINNELTDTSAGFAILIEGFYNAITVRNCRFSNCDKCIVMANGIGASVRVEDCTMEGYSANTYASIGSVNIFEGIRALTFTGNYLEALKPTANYAAIELDSCNGVKISGNTFSGDFGGSYITDTFLYFTNSCTAVTVEDNWFNEPSVYVARHYLSTQPIKFHRNYYYKVSAITGYNAIMAYFNSPNYVELDVPYTFTWNPGSLVDGAGEESPSQSITGLQFGDQVLAAAGVSTLSMLVYGYVNANGDGRVRLQNETGGTIDLASSTWTLRILKAYN